LTEDAPQPNVKLDIEIVRRQVRGHLTTKFRKRKWWCIDYRL